MTARDALFQKYLALPKGAYRMPEIVKLDPKKTMLIPMNGLGITCRNSRIPVHGTAALNPCLGVGLYNLKTGKLVISHEQGDFVRQFKEAMIEIRWNDEEKIAGHFIGVSYEYHYMDSQVEDLKDLCEVIETTPNFTVETFDTGNKPHPGAFAIDASRNGLLIRGGEDISIYGDEEDYFRDLPTTEQDRFDATGPEFIVQRTR